MRLSSDIPEICPRYIGTFSAGRQKVFARAGRLVVDKEAPHRRFVANVEHVAFSGADEKQGRVCST